MHTKSISSLYYKQTPFSETRSRQIQDRINLEHYKKIVSQKIRMHHQNSPSDIFATSINKRSRFNQDDVGFGVLETTNTTNKAYIGANQKHLYGKRGLQLIQSRLHRSVNSHQQASNSPMKCSLPLLQQQ